MKTIVAPSVVITERYEPGPAAPAHTPLAPTSGRASRNPWLASSVHAASLGKQAGVDQTAVGPTRGRLLSAGDAKTAPSVFAASPTVKRVGGDTIVVAAGIEGIRKIIATGDGFTNLSFLPYPRYESLAADATPKMLGAALDEANEARRARDDVRIRALSRTLDRLGFNRRNAPNGTHNLIDRDGYHYCGFGGFKVLKSTDENSTWKAQRYVKSRDFATLLPAPLVTHSVIKGLAMTYAGDLVIAASHALLLVDRALDIKDALFFPGETIEQGICTDETGIYVPTSQRMLKVVWTGTRLSHHEADGGWEAVYDVMTPDQAMGLGSLTSGGSGTSPALMGFDDDPDQLVLLGDANRRGTHLVAFWRHEIPRGSRRLEGRSARVADQIRIDVARLPIECPLAVDGYGVLVLNTSFPRAVQSIWGNTMTAGVTRPSPVGVQKFVWNTETRSLEKAWFSFNVDNADRQTPLVSSASGMVYLANKRRGNYEILGLDWTTGAERAIWSFPDDSRMWNGCGSELTLLENGDFLVGGLFATKRVRTGF